MGPRDFHYSTLRVLEREVGGAGGVVSLVAFLGGSGRLGRLLGALRPALGRVWGGSWARLGRLLGGSVAQLGRLCAAPGWLCGALGPAWARLGRLPECQLCRLFL